MEIDEGTRGLAQSRHHPQYQEATRNMAATGTQNEHGGRSEFETKIQGILIGLGVQDPSGRLPGVLAEVLTALGEERTKELQELWKITEELK
jgi:hypothetical protein